MHTCPIVNVLLSTKEMVGGKQTLISMNLQQLSITYMEMCDRITASEIQKISTSVRSIISMSVQTMSPIDQMLHIKQMRILNIPVRD